MFVSSMKKDIKSTLLVSCTISYILLTFVSLLRINFLRELPDTAVINSAICSIFSVIMSIIFGIVYNSKYYKLITVYLFHKTTSTDIWRDVLDLINGSNLKVYLKEKPYYLIGHHKIHEENGNDSWFALNGFAKIDIITNEPYKNEPSYIDNKNIIITIRLSDVEHIEIF